MMNKDEIRINSDVSIPNNFLNIMDNPLTPPNTMLLGNKNILNETEIKNNPTNKYRYLNGLNFLYISSIIVSDSFLFFLLNITIPP